MLYLDIPYKLKDYVKKMGAKWNPTIKKWYVEKKENYLDFSHYILKDAEDAVIVKDCIYLVVGKQKCWKCHKETAVIGSCIPNQILLHNSPLINWENTNFDEEYDYTKFFYKKEEFEIKEFFSYDILNLQDISKKLLNYIQKNYNYKLMYSRMLGEKYYANCCEHCNSLQGDHFLFDELDSPFNILSKEMASKLEFIKFDLKNDFILYGYTPPANFYIGYSEKERESDIESFSKFSDSYIEIDDII